MLTDGTNTYQKKIVTIPNIHFFRLCLISAMPAAATNPIIAILCGVAGIIAALPLLVAIIIGLTNLITSTKKNKEQDGKD